MKTLIYTYMVGNPPEVRAQIACWERELNDNIKNQDIPVEEWEDMVQDPGNTRRRHTLFRQTIHQYWVMKNVVARAMTLKKEQATSKGSEAQEDTKQKDPIRAELLKEIAIAQIQTY